jgi:hypothetical protein
MLCDQGTGATGVPDPCRHPRALPEGPDARIDDAASAWVNRLAPRPQS